MEDIRPLKLTLGYFYAAQKPLYLLGAIALAKRFKKPFTNKELHSYFYELYQKGIDVYGYGNENPAETYYKRGVLAKIKEENGTAYRPFNYKVIRDRIKIIEKEFKKPEFSDYQKFLDQIDELIEELHLFSL